MIKLGYEIKTGKETTEHFEKEVRNSSGGSNGS